MAKFFKFNVNICSCSSSNKNLVELACANETVMIENKTKNEIRK